MSADVTQDVPGPLRRRPVIADVALSAGVSAQTVSRVVNGGSGVGESTRARVQAVIDALGYRPNASAQALAAGREHSIHVLTSETTLYGHATILRGIEGAAAAAGYRLSVGILEAGRGEPALATSVAAGNAVIIFAFDPIGLAAVDALPAGAVAVALGDLEGRGLPAVIMAEKEGAADATRHLLDLGHSTVHHLTVPVAAGRRPGWTAALREAGRPVPEPVAAGWDARSGAEATRRLLQEHPDVTAVLCGNDDLALGALHVLRRAGRRVPQDVSVVGFDDVPGAAYFEPPLTTVAQDFIAMGRSAFDLLNTRLGAPEVVQPDVWLPTRLVVRESTGPLGG